MRDDILLNIFLHCFYIPSLPYIYCIYILVLSVLSILSNITKKRFDNHNYKLYIYRFQQYLTLLYPVT